MTRAELIATLAAMTPEALFSFDEIKRIKRLAFWVWWYGKSDEAGKPHPREPEGGYNPFNLYPALDYFRSVDAAMTLIPEGRYWIIAAGRTRPNEPLYGAQTLVHDKVIGEAETEVSAALAMTIAALRDRESGL